MRLDSFTSIWVAAPAWALAVLATGTAHAASQFEQTVAADPKGSVEISNVNGKIEVEGWDQKQVSISAYLEDHQKVEVNTDHGRISITVRDRKSVV